MASYTTEERGSRNSVEYRLFFKVCTNILFFIEDHHHLYNHDHLYHHDHNHNDDDVQDGEGNPISAMHDIPMLSGDGVYNMVVEVVMMKMMMVMMMATIMMMASIMIMNDNDRD